MHDKQAIEPKQSTNLSVTNVYSCCLVTLSLKSWSLNMTINLYIQTKCKIIDTYLSTQLWESFTDKWEGIIIDNMPVKNVKLTVWHGILLHKTHMHIM